MQVSKEARTDSEIVEHYLTSPQIHQKWIRNYRSSENETFFSLAFDYIARSLNAPAGSVILDAGCGTCAHSIRFAERGFLVEAIDISRDAVELGREQVQRHGLSGVINVQCGNLRSIPFEDGRFPYIFCWGVLMHVPEIGKALSELHRVLTPGGLMVLGENNMYSVQSVALRFLRKLLHRTRTKVHRTEAGLESWHTEQGGMLLTRENNIKWLAGGMSEEWLSSSTTRGRSTLGPLCMDPVSAIKKTHPCH